MDSAEQTPVIIGVGQLLQRAEDPRDAAEPPEMMRWVLEQAGIEAPRPTEAPGGGRDTGAWPRTVVLGTYGCDHRPASSGLGSKFTGPNAGRTRSAC